MKKSKPSLGVYGSGVGFFPPIRLMLSCFGLLILAAPGFSRAAASLWQPLPLLTQASLSAGNSGGEGGQVIQNFAIDSTGQFLMMGTDVGGLFKSLNGGTSWQPADAGFMPRGACAFAIDPNNSNRVLAVGDNSGAQAWNGLWLSTDQASSWAPVREENYQGSGTYHDSAAFDASSMTVSGGVTFSALAYWVNYSDGGGGLWKSTNGGSSWSEIQSSFADGIVKVNPASGAVYVATANGFYVSTNGGSSFTQVVSGPVLGLDVIATQPNNVYINEAKGVYVSTNSGQGFTAMGNSGLPTGASPGLRNLKVSPVNPNNMLIDEDMGTYTSQNYFYSSNGGSSWSACALNSTQSFIPLNTREWLFVWSPVNANQAWACGGDFISQTTNGGANFSWSSNGYNDFTCTGLFNFNPQNPNLLLVTSQDYNSAFTAAVTNNAVPWQYLGVSGQGWGGFTYGGYALSSTVMVAGNSPSWGAPATLMLSTNGGSSFTSTGLVGNNTQTACGDPVSATVAFWDNYRTTNGGTSWQAMANCDGVFTFNSNPAGAHELYGAKGSTVVKSTDHGATWTTVVTVPGTVADIAYDWANNRLYIVSGATLVVYGGSGSSTTNLSGLLPVDNNGNQSVASVAVDPVNPNIVYAAWNGGNYMSTQAIRYSLNAGQTWGTLTKQPGDTGLDGGKESVCVRVHPLTRYLYSTGSCFGVWKYPPPASGSATATPTTGTATATRTATSTATRTATALPTATPIWSATPIPTVTGTNTTVPFTPTNSPLPTTATLTPVVPSTWRVNAGGPAYTDSVGNLWSADSQYSGGTAVSRGEPSPEPPIPPFMTPSATAVVSATSSRCPPGITRSACSSRKPIREISP